VLRRHGPSPARAIARRAECNLSTVQTTLNRLVYSGLLSFAEMRLGRYARPRRDAGWGRRLRIYYIPGVHSSRKVYAAIKSMIVFRKPVSTSERRGFGIWLSSNILPAQVKETIQSLVYGHGRQMTRPQRY